MFKVLRLGHSGFGVEGLIVLLRKERWYSRGNGYSDVILKVYTQMLITAAVAPSPPPSAVLCDYYTNTAAFADTYQYCSVC